MAAFVVFATSASAQQLYKFQDANGNWVYSDQRPGAGLEVEILDWQPAAETGGVWLRQGTNADDTPVLVAVNRFHDWVQIAFALESSVNLDLSVPTAGNRLLPPQSETELLALSAANPAQTIELAYRYQYIHGHPGARHDPDQPYRLPYALANAHLITQAYPDASTHEGPENRHAVDFAMPIGTGVYAARGGVVVEVASENFTSGLNPEVDLGRANFVRILHDDGTLALYGHLNWNSIRVVPGQRVARGEYIADSGNTGFSSGPHLHFVVQRNAGGAVESVPVRFLGARGEALILRSGD
ncbi:MAG: M23 family metallopeptidase, partial [Gammaproteobacteria bacterium]|nr:M23 family metallopeptidase [Gammaproteobacteria bacterium]